LESKKMNTKESEIENNSTESKWNRK